MFAIKTSKRKLPQCKLNVFCCGYVFYAERATYSDKVKVSGCPLTQNAELSPCVMVVSVTCALPGVAAGGSVAIAKWNINNAKN